MDIRLQNVIIELKEMGVIPENCPELITSLSKHLNEPEDSIFAFWSGLNDKKDDDEHKDLNISRFTRNQYLF